MKEDPEVMKMLDEILEGMADDPEGTPLDFEWACVKAYRDEKEAQLQERRRLVDKAFYSTFHEDRFEVAEDGESVDVQGTVFTAYLIHGAVEFRLAQTCPQCKRWHMYSVASRADIGRVLSMGDCADCAT